MLLEHRDSVSLLSGRGLVMFTIVQRNINLDLVLGIRMNYPEKLSRGAGQYIWLLSVGFQL